MVGLLNAKDDQTMLLMSDNVMDQDIVSSMALDSQIKNSDAIGVQTVPLSQSSRFTRIQRKEGFNDQYIFVEGGSVGKNDVWSGQNAKVWCGPVIFQTSRALKVLSDEWSQHSQSFEMKIGPHLNAILRHPIHLYDVKAFDVGIPTAYAAQLKAESL